MSELKGKEILIGVTGSIAAYKACEVIRLLRKEGAVVQVMMTNSAQEFVGKASFAALTDQEVATELFPKTPKAGLEHIGFAINLDALIILPATANILTKAAAGIADDLVSTTLAVCEQPTLFVPAMNFRMWENPATMEAVIKLRRRGKRILDPDTGPLASLHEGAGRLPEIGLIMDTIRELFDIPQPLNGKKVLVTAGPTREAIDPVRYLSNRSSGRMGYALAEAARDSGARVTLVSGPVALPEVPETKRIKIESAAEMETAVRREIDNQDFDLIVMAAAVSDFSVENPAEQKIKRGSQEKILKLTPAPDILAGIKSRTDARIVAFALETENGEREAKRKMAAKGADHIVLNYANEPGAGFESSTNHVYVYSQNGNSAEFPTDRKDRIARKILNYIIEEEGWS